MAQPQHNPFHWTRMHDHMHQRHHPQREMSGYAVNTAFFPVNMERVAGVFESMPLTREYNVRYPHWHQRYQGLP